MAEIKRRSGLTRDEECLLKRLWLSAEDFRQAAAFANYLLALPEVSSADAKYLQLAVNTAVVISYCRPFTKNAPHKQTPTERTYRARVLNSLPKEYCAAFSDDESAFHRHIRRQRNQDLAHSDAVASNLQLSKSELGVHGISRNQFLPLGKSQLALLQSMLTKLQAAVDERKRLLEEKMLVGSTF